MFGPDQPASSYPGNHKALLVGINYIGTAHELNGCINDVENVKAYLTANGFDESNILMLTDDQDDYSYIPTKDVVLGGMSWLVEGASEGDSLVFHYSGHGGQEPSYSMMESTGKDSTICPLDFETAGQLTDDEMHEMLVDPLPSGCKLFAIFDSCHSGTVLDLPYMYRADTGDVSIKQFNMWEEQRDNVQDMLTGDVSGGLQGMLETLLAPVVNTVSKVKNMSPADVFSISGCRDSQTSADATINGESSGALSWALIEALKSQQTYLSLLQNIRELLEANGYSQRPQLSSSHEMELDVPFEM